MVSKIFLISIVLATCGRYSKEESSIIESQKWDKIKAIVKTECVGCHDGSIRPSNFNNEEAFSSSTAKARIANDTMPPNKKLEAKDKATLLGYFERDGVDKAEERCFRTRCF